MESFASDDCDEDIILPNSPLSAYIKEFEMNEGKTECIGSTLKSEKRKTIAYFWTLNNVVIRKKCVTKLKEIYFQIYDFFSPLFSGLDSVFLKRALNDIEKSNLLVNEDVAFLKCWCSDSIEKQKFSFTYFYFHRLLGFILLYFFTCIIFTYFDMNFPNFFTTSNEQYFQETIQNVFKISEISYFSLLLLCAFFVVCFVRLVSLFLLCYHLKNILSAATETSLICRKNLKLIQESELIARGFTSTSNSSIAQRIELSEKLPFARTHRHHLTLRKSLFFWIRELFLNYRLITLGLFHEIQLSPEFDFSSHTLAMLDLQEFGNLVQLNQSSEKDVEELLKVTDNFSITSLRTVFSLMKLQISEYFKYFYFILTIISCDKSYKGSFQVALIKLLKNIIISKENDYILLKVCEAYRYYRSIEASSNVEHILSPQNCNHFALEVSIHNMSLHLKAALTRLLKIEDYLNLKELSTISKSPVLLKNVKDLLNQINGELNAYTENFSSCSEQVDKLLCKKTNDNDYTVIEPGIELIQNVDSSRPIIKCDKEQEIKDEVFEGIVDNTVLECCDSKKNELDMEIKKSSELASNLMHELKNVLIIKADEHRLREEKALITKISMEVCEDAGNPKSSSNDLVVNHETSECNVTPNERDSQSVKLNFNMAKHLNTTSDFKASIAALANQRKLMLDIPDEACYIGDSDDCYEE